MDQKTWLWRRKSSEKTILANPEEVGSVSSEKEVKLENSLKILNEKLACAVDECSAKDELVEDYKREAEIAVADKQKSEEEIRRLKEELDEAQQQRAAANERLGHLNSTLKECMEQLSVVRQEQEQRMHDAVMKTSEEFEKSHKKLEEKLSEMGKRLASVTAENSYLSKALVVKEKLIENLNGAKIQTEAEFETLMTRLDSVEKENAFLRYEFRSLEKELDHRNEEMEFSRRSAEASNKQYLDNVKKIKKLEAECQRLRALTRKRLPGPFALANMPRDIEAQGRNQSNTRRKAMQDSDVYCPDSTSKQLGFLIDQVQDLQKENNIFKEFLAKKEEEILHLRKLKNVNVAAPDEHSSTSCCGTHDPNEINSGALVLVSGKEDNRFTDSKTKPECQMIGASEMSLMDDFVEMEKLAIVAVDSPLEGSIENQKALVPMGSDYYSDTGHELKAKSLGNRKSDDWLQTVTNMILEQHNVSRRSIDELLQDITMSLRRSIHPELASKPIPISGYITWKSPSSSPTPSRTLIQESNTEFLQPDMNKSITKLIELIAAFDSLPTEDLNSQDYEVHAFRWKKSDFTAVLQEFIDSCNKLLDGKISFEKFSGDLTYILGWIINSCITFQDSCGGVREEFSKHLGGDGPGTALELESVQNLMLEMEKMHSISQVEIEGLKNNLSFVKSSEKSLDSSLLSGRQNNEMLVHKLLQSQQSIAGLQNKMEILKESKRVTENQLENVKAINEEIDTRLTVTKAKLNEVLQKSSSVEVELDNKSHCCEELEGTCLELQLQLESIANKPYSKDDHDQGGLLQTGMEITKASAKLAECEDTILKLGKQLKALGSSKELSVVDKVLSIADNNKQKIKQRSSLRDQMIYEDSGDANSQESPKTKEIISTTEATAPSVGNYNAISFPDGQVATPRSYLGINDNTKNVKSGALVIVPIKKRGGVGFLGKLLLRRKKASSKNTTIYFGK